MSEIQDTYRVEDLASLIVLFLRVAKNEYNEMYDDFDEQIRSYHELAKAGPAGNPFVQNIFKIAQAREDYPQIAALIEEAREAIGRVLVTMVQEETWHRCAVIDREHIQQMAGLSPPTFLAAKSFTAGQPTKKGKPKGKPKSKSKGKGKGKKKASKKKKK